MGLNFPIDPDHPSLLWNDIFQDVVKMGKVRKQSKLERVSVMCVCLEVLTTDR